MGKDRCRGRRSLLSSISSITRSVQFDIYLCIMLTTGVLKNLGKSFYNSRQDLSPNSLILFELICQQDYNEDLRTKSSIPPSAGDLVPFLRHELLNFDFLIGQVALVPRNVLRLGIVGLSCYGTLPVCGISVGNLTNKRHFSS